MKVRELEAKIHSLREQFLRTMNELREAEAEHDALVKFPEMQGYVGRCFKYRNCYSCSQNESDYWWLYLRITRIDEGCYVGIKLQTDSHGWSSIAEERVPTLDSYIKIDAVEFAMGVKPIVKKLMMILES